MKIKKSLCALLLAASLPAAAADLICHEADSQTADSLTQTWECTYAGTLAQAYAALWQDQTRGYQQNPHLPATLPPRSFQRTLTEPAQSADNTETQHSIELKIRRPSNNRLELSYRGGSEAGDLVFKTEFRRIGTQVRIRHQRTAS